MIERPRDRREHPAHPHRTAENCLQSRTAAELASLGGHDDPLSNPCRHLRVCSSGFVQRTGRARRKRIREWRSRTRRGGSRLRRRCFVRWAGRRSWYRRQRRGGIDGGVFGGRRLLGGLRSVPGWKSYVPFEPLRQAVCRSRILHHRSIRVPGVHRRRRLSGSGVHGLHRRQHGLQPPEVFER
jgi:hypothetical protein